MLLKFDYAIKEMRKIIVSKQYSIDHTNKNPGPRYEERTLECLSMQMITIAELEAAIKLLKEAESERG